MCSQSLGFSCHRFHLRLDETQGREFFSDQQWWVSLNFSMSSSNELDSFSLYAGKLNQTCLSQLFFRIKMKRKSEIPHIPHCITVSLDWLSTISNAILNHQTGQLHHEQTKESAASSLRPHKKRTICSNLKKMTSNYSKYMQV